MLGYIRLQTKKIDAVVTKYKNHLSIIAIKRKININHAFDFRIVNLFHIMKRMKISETNKTSSDNLKQTRLQ